MTRTLGVLLIVALAAGTAAQRLPLPSQRAMSVPAAMLLLALDRLQAGRWYPQTPALLLQLQPDRDVLQQALTSTDAELRRLAVRGLGRMESPADLPVIAAFRLDRDPRVRREANNAIAQAVIHAKPAEVMSAYDMLKVPAPPMTSPTTGQVLTGPQYDAIEDMRVEAIARLHYEPAAAQQVLNDVLPIVTGRFLGQLLRFVQRNPKIELTEPQINTLRGFDINPTAMKILGATRHQLPPEAIIRAAKYKPINEPIPYPASAAVRMLGVENLAPLDPVMGPVLEGALADTWPTVRVMALRRIATVIAETRTCQPMLDVLNNDAELAMLRIEAIDLLDVKCREREDVVRVLKAALIPGGSLLQNWPLRAHALTKLAAIDQPAAQEFLDRCDADGWPVKIACAHVAVSLRDGALLRKLVNDVSPNVQAEALTDLASLADPSASETALRLLQSRDYQLIWTAAHALRRTALPRDMVLNELWRAFKWLTQQERDDTRFPRLEILDRLREWAPATEVQSAVLAYAGDLRVTLLDTDPLVAEAAADALFRLTGTKPRATPTWKPPLQPSIEDLRALPASAIVQLDTGESVVLAMLPDDAPIAVARFAKMVRQGYFTSQPFQYRVAPFIASNGGSPNGNDMSGDARFFRDEIGTLRHDAGVVGLLEPGRDTGDGRFFIDFMEQPGFDYEYTLFARASWRIVTEPWQWGMNPSPPIAALVRGGTVVSVVLR